METSRKRKSYEEGELFKEESKYIKGEPIETKFISGISELPKSENPINYNKQLYDKIISYINESYDMSDIERILYINDSIELLQELLEYIDINKNKIFSNDVLKKLFNNYYKPPPITKINLNIIGPSVYKHYYAEEINNIYNFNIHLFGETHYQVNNCIENKLENIYNIDFINYLNIKLKNSYSFSDVYLEIYKYNNQTRIEKKLNTIIDTYEKYKKCLNISTRDEDCDLFRFHYVDLRHMDDSFTYIISEVLELLMKIKINYQRNKNNEEFTDMVYNLIKTDIYIKFIRILVEMGESKNLYNFILLDIFNLYVIKKLMGSYLMDEIIEFIRNKLIINFEPFEFNKILLDIIQNIIMYDTEIKDIIIENPIDIHLLKKNFIKLFRRIEIMELYLIKIYQYKMDIYALSRIFKIFQEKNLKQPKFVKTIYVYAGNYHIELYSEFIESLKEFRLIKDIRPDYEDKSCITLKDNLPIEEILGREP